MFLDLDFLREEKISLAFKTDIGSLIFTWIFRTSWPKMFFFINGRRDGAILTPQRTRLYFWGFYVCAIFGENRSRNATVRVAQTDTHHTDRRKPVL